ncbi:META domain-containing protein [Taibaiella sp. KBW10]|uniref:META domain-containing protein n=1 Tax=Taibaiella sp. KBW10 TaxID=2153357 RepID=UPI0013157087|nr:META domain-containing protein [Taibaiella sp. KBW10]
MNKLKTGLSIVFVTMMSLQAVAQHPKGHSSKNSLDWRGIYSTGKDLQLILNDDNTYSLTQNGKISTGKVKWNKAGSMITLPHNNMQFKVGERQLTGLRYGTLLLKQETAVVDVAGPSTAIDNTDADALYGGKWVLIELQGKEVSEYSENAKKAFISFDAAEKRFGGSGGCNSFGGNFEVPGHNRIKFGQTISTMKACIGKGVEAEPILLNVLRTADNFTVSNGVLSLNKARMASLARFRMVVK